MKTSIRLSVALVGLVLAVGLTVGTVLVGPILVVAAGVLLGVGVWIQWCRRDPALALVAIVAVVVYSSHLFALAYSAGLPAEVVKVAIGVKDVLAWTLLAALAARTVARSRRAEPILLVVLTLLVFGAFFVLSPSPVPVTVQIESLRGALIPVLALGCVALLDRQERRRVSTWTIRLTVVAAAYALVEIVLPRSFLTSVIGVGRFWVEVKQVPLFIDPESGLPFNFTITSGFPRLTGTFGDPLSAGTVLGAVLVLAVAYRQELRVGSVQLALLAGATLLTFTRGGWIVAVVGLAVLSLRRHGVPRTALWFTAAAVTSGVAVLVVAPLRTYLSNVFGGADGSTLAHQEALSESANYVFTALGSGWGTGGTQAKNSFSGAVSSESTYIALGAQIGIVGLVLTAVLVILLGRAVVRDHWMAPVGVAVLATIAVNGLVSESMLTFNGAFVPFLVVGLASASPSGRADTESSSGPATPAGPDPGSDVTELLPLRPAVPAQPVAPSEAARPMTPSG